MTARPSGEEAYRKPLPTVSDDGEYYWRAAREGRFVLQRCRSCHRYQFPSRVLCAHCGVRDPEWVENDGAGEVYSFTVVHRPPEQSFMPDVPYVVAIIQLDAGPRMMSNIVGVPSGQVRIGMRVCPIFERATDEITFVKFTPA